MKKNNNMALTMIFSFIVGGLFMLGILKWTPVLGEISEGGNTVINNGSHETVGGMPTVSNTMDLVSIAKACGYPNAVSVDNFDDLDSELEKAKESSELCFIEVMCSIGAREDLGRPTTTAIENKENFMKFLKD